MLRARRKCETPFGPPVGSGREGYRASAKSRFVVGAKRRLARQNPNLAEMENAA